MLSQRIVLIVCVVLLHGVFVICDHNSWIIQLNPALFCFLWVVSQIGMRTDSAIASVYDEDGKEIENSELLFMEEGVSKIQLCFINLQ